MTIVSFQDMFHINNNHNRLKEKKKRNFILLISKFFDLEFAFPFNYSNKAKHCY